MTTNWLDPQLLERVVGTETSLAFEASTGKDDNGQTWYLLTPEGLPTVYTFGIRISVGWRRISIALEPGTFAGDLLSKMGAADDTGRTAFRTVLADCIAQGAEIEFQVNGTTKRIDSDEAFSEVWNRILLKLNKGQLELGVNEGDPDPNIICRWACRFAAAITAILPLEEESEIAELELKGYPEGAISEIKINRYERDRRNRAAAISIHGTSCQGCGMDFGSVYGEIAEGFIEVHHIKPVSKLGANYRVDPLHDLVPLCANCHAVVHRREPPLDINELRKIILHPQIAEKTNS